MFIFEYMAMYFRTVIFVAVLPALVLMFLIYRQDRIEREPPGLLLKIFLWGAVVTLPAGWIERVLIMLLDMLIPNEYSIMYQFVMYFCIVAVVEEVLKYLVVRKTTWKHPAFGYRFDAVVYGAFSALGFAAAENIMYVMNLGIGVAPIRAVTAVPLHCICGIFMGHFYGQEKACNRWGMRGNGVVYFFLSLLVPILIHGFYDFTASASDGFLSVLFVVFIVVLYIVTIHSVRRYSAEDGAV